MTLASTEPRATAAEWALTRDTLTTTVQDMATLAGMSDAPAVKFTAPWTRNGIHYGAHHRDVLGVSLAVFDGPMTDVSRFYSHGVGVGMQGVILHELGHRRDRAMLAWGTGIRLPGYVSAAAVLVWFAAKLLFGLSDGWAVMVAAVLAVVWAVWFCVWVIVGRWFERRADDHMLDVGGPDRTIKAFELLHAFADGKSGRDLVHPSVKNRRRRQDRRSGGLVGEHTEND